jgi:hypothetical protein
MLLTHPSPQGNTRIKVIVVAKLLFMPVVQRLWRCEHVYPRAERVLILEHYFVSKEFAVVREAFSSAYSHKRSRISQ